ncbi:HAD family hydrolase [Candidatus Bathyarchaeota archaeon]|nr:HAD family hydrolase [Candidatus Bathyarchaeota archaeon]
MSKVKAVIFDFIGTLINVRGYNLEVSKVKLYKAIVNAGFKVNSKDFLDAYTRAHEKYRVIRYQKLVEVTNAIWISEALNTLGFATNPDDGRIKAAVNIFFEDYVNSFRLRKCAKKVLQVLSENYKLGLISNFTYAPVIYAGLTKVGINKFFNTVLVSDAVGWRKPHAKIFEEALKKLGVTAGETLYIGDSPDEDIKGAKQLGMKTIFVASQFHTFEALRKSGQKPDATARSLCEAFKKISEICLG